MFLCDPVVVFFFFFFFFFLTRPEKTFAGFADILGLVFLMIGLLWTVQAFTERPLNDVWRLGLISGSLMV